MQEPRFAFGRNWTDFGKLVGTDRVREAADSLKGLLAVDDLKGRSFLDAGCGSGLFSVSGTKPPGNSEPKISSRTFPDTLIRKRVVKRVGTPSATSRYTLA